LYGIKLLLLIFFSSSLFSVDYTQKSEVKHFIKMMHSKFNYNRDYLHTLFQNVRKEPQYKTKKPSKKVLDTSPHKELPQGSWEIYSRMHLGHNRTNMGVDYMHKYRSTFKKAYQKYGVSPEYITAIIGIESYYGKNRGNYFVFDTLTQLAFGKNRRKKFYRHELQEFLRMCYREAVEPRAIKGSKSGAIGLAQFMPSNYKSLAVDFNNDGKIRISTPIDAIGSVANYFKESGWKRDEPVGTRVSYRGNRFYMLKTGYKHKYQRQNLANIYPKKPFKYSDKVMLIKLEKEKYDELWYGTHNFYVITRYNHNDYYAMAVHQLAQKIKRSYIKKYGNRHYALK
jgi:membrane-bound lytic murein transglycosylase B